MECCSCCERKGETRERWKEKKEKENVSVIGADLSSPQASAIADALLSNLRGCCDEKEVLSCTDAEYQSNLDRDAQNCFGLAVCGSVRAYVGPLLQIPAISLPKIHAISFLGFYAL